MKKTSIILNTLSALIVATAGVSYAATGSLGDALVSQVGSSQLQVTTSLSEFVGLTGNFTYTFTLDPTSEALNIVGKDKTNKAITFVSVKDSANHIFGTGIGISSSQQIITQAGVFAQFNKEANTTNIIGGSYSGGQADLFGKQGERTVDWANLSGIAITLTHQKGTRSDMYITMSYDSKDPETFTVDASSLKWSTGETTPEFLGVNTNVVTSAYFFEGLATQDQAFALNTAAIKAVPEPTTGSLSLLALAGLCARRRKK